jgi:hypothetical protein
VCLFFITCFLNCPKCQVETEKGHRQSANVALLLLLPSLLSESEEEEEEEEEDILFEMLLLIFAPCNKLGKSKDGNFGSLKYNLTCSIFYTFDII